MEKHMNAWQALKADTHRQYGRFSFRVLVHGIATQRTFRVQVTMRFCQLVAASHNPVAKLLLPLCIVLHRFATQSAAMDFPWRTKIGGGLALTHGWGMVVGRYAQIGNNVTLFHGVTLGRRSIVLPNGERQYRWPVLEDEVWVGPHAIIVGNITIGRGSRIAGGAFVTDSIPPFSLVSGNPAVIVKRNCKSDIENPAPL
jgi:serine O-acetyltransferase